MFTRHAYWSAVVCAIAFALVACTHTRKPHSQPRITDWRTCAAATARDMLSNGTDDTWPQASALPEGPLETVTLGATHPDALHDSDTRIIHLHKEGNSFYLEQIGGFAGFQVIYGPVSLQGHCSPH